MAGAKPQSQARRVVDKFEKPTEHSSQPIFYVAVAAVLAGYYAYPHKTNPLYPAIFLSYPVPTSMTSTQPPQYGKGPKDLIYVGFYTLVLFAARDFIRHYVSPVLARSWGVHDAYKQTRFSQELYQAVYFASMAAFGLYIMRGTPVWFFNMPGLFVGFPHRTLDAGFKAFYLIQSANWVQQAAVTFLGLEKARKDTAVMVSHHIVTLTAIPLIYNAHMTSFALALIIPHDISDALLAFGKCISYSGPSTLVAFPYFTLFVGSWIYFRHYVGSITFWTLLTKYKPAITTVYGWENEQWKATLLHGLVVSLFGALQIMNAYWLSLILKVVAKAASGTIPKDERESEDEVEIEKSN